MARTKRAQAPKPIESNKSQKSSKIWELIQKKINEEEEKTLAHIESKMQEELDDLKIFYTDIKTKLPMILISRTVRDIENGDVDSLSGSVLTISDLTNTLNFTKTVSSNKKQIGSTCTDSDALNATKAVKTERASRSRTKRVGSLGNDDEGYTTAESSRGTTSGDRHLRQSRSRTNTTTVKQSSRSLSRTALKGKSTYKTPVNRQPPPNSLGTITPKCKLNTPQVFLRRPKMGEMAWSNQGSPLMTGPVAPEEQANINIPLPDGNLISLLPQRGVRVSQIPQVDDDTRRQLEVLRDNLIKVCSGMKK